MTERTDDMTEAEMVEVLKAIIRDGKNGAARIAAIKELRAIQGDRKPAVTGFDALDTSGPRLKVV
jgi:hypothetical protein